MSRSIPSGHRWKPFHGKLPEYVDQHMRSNPLAYYCYVRDKMLLTVMSVGRTAVYYHDNKINTSERVKAGRGMKAFATYALHDRLKMPVFKAALAPAPSPLVPAPPLQRTLPSPSDAHRLSIRVFGQHADVDAVYDTIKGALSAGGTHGVTILIERGAV